jgi:hypothetical protein
MSPHAHNTVVYMASLFNSRATYFQPPTVTFIVQNKQKRKKRLQQQT